MNDKRFLTALAHARLGKTNFRMRNEAFEYCRENDVKVVLVNGADIELHTPEGIVFVAPDAFTRAGDIKKRLKWGRRLYTVHFCDEYEFDDDGNNIPLVVTVNSEDEAYRLAVEWFERTACIANITSDVEML